MSLAFVTVCADVTYPSLLRIALAKARVFPENVRPSHRNVRGTHTYTQTDAPRMVYLNVFVLVLFRAK